MLRQVGGISFPSTGGLSIQFHQRRRRMTCGRGSRNGNLVDRSANPVTPLLKPCLCRKSDSFPSGSDARGERYACAAR